MPKQVQNVIALQHLLCSRLSYRALGPKAAARRRSRRCRRGLHIAVLSIL